MDSLNFEHFLNNADYLILDILLKVCRFKI